MNNLDKFYQGCETKTTKLIMIIGIVMIVFNGLKAQVAITPDISSADPSAIIEVKSTEKGLLIPRMTGTERDDIVTPTEGLMVCLTDGTEGLYYYDGSSWPAVAGNSIGTESPLL